jgi:hypothetical protein
MSKAEDDGGPAVAEDLPIADIRIEPACRRDYGDLRSLARSIRKRGLRYPIVVDRARRVIAGERRLRAARIAKLPVVPAYVVGTIGELHDVMRAVTGDDVCRLPTRPTEAVAKGLRAESLDYGPGDEPAWTAAAVAGLRVTRYRYARAVVLHVDASGTDDDLVEMLDNKSVCVAYRELRARRNGSARCAPRRNTGPSKIGLELHGLCKELLQHANTRYGEVDYLSLQRAARKLYAKICSYYRIRK